MKKRSLLSLLLLLALYCCLSQAQGQKSLHASKTSGKPTIDGLLDDPLWQEAETATGFIQYEPFNGEEPHQQTQVRIAYDNNSLYIAAMMYDDQSEKIMRELGERDQRNLNADYIMVCLGPYNDGMNAFCFYVYASGVQMDMKYYTGGKDFSWDAVWKSEVAITSDGWTAEMEIPYSAIRFPRQQQRSWSLNFTRHIRRKRETSTWNFVDKAVSGEVNQAGLLQGIREIKPPLRLSLEPYLVTNMAKDPDKPTWGFNIGGGMDLKLGLSESFTLDMTLIPDFSQVQSDDIVVNMSPFETYYSERRQFFTEGLELFSRGDIFYSRRVGSRPVGYDKVQEDYAEEDILANPAETRLLNATKISGRTSGGAGLGLFNAMTAPSYATLQDEEGNSRDTLTQAFTNYNMLVFDQSLPNNSYVSVYNTNVYRGRNEYTANVSGTEMDFRDRKNTFSLYGLLNVSQKYYPDQSPDLGFKYAISLAKIRGKATFGVNQSMESDDYDPNDLGYDRNNNVFINGAYFKYSNYDPFWVILEMNNTLRVNYSQLYAPRDFTGLEISINNWIIFKNHLTVGINANLDPLGTRDYFEPRNEGWFVNYPASYSISAFVSPDYNKTFVVDASSSISWSNKYDQLGYSLRLSPRYKVNDRLLLVLSASYSQNLNNLGYVLDSLDNSDLRIIFGERDIENITTTFNVKYTINTRLNLNLRLRHYYFKADYDNYYDLREDGELLNTDYVADEDFLYKAFNIDAYFTWLFAPGSELVLAWKNAIYSDQDLPSDGYFRELAETLDMPASNLLSLKVLYYLDARYLKRLKRKSVRQ